MNINDKDKWIADVFDSMKGSKRLKPNSDLFAKINIQINSQETKIIPIRQWNYAIASAFLLLVLNVFVMRQVSQNDKLYSGDMVAMNSSSQSLISNYQIYK